jgi:hypothetical protein
MRKYPPIALALAIFAATPALAKTMHHSAKQSMHNLHMSAIRPSQGVTTGVGIVGKLHNPVDAPDLDCIQHAFGADIALAC